MDAFDARWRRSPCSPRLALLHADRTHNDCATPATHSAKSAAEIAPACDYRDRFTEPPQGVADVKRTGRATRPPILDPAVVLGRRFESCRGRHRPPSSGRAFCWSEAGLRAWKSAGALPRRPKDGRALSGCHRGPADGGAIPACAGSTPLRTATPHGPSDHPRACGEGRRSRPAPARTIPARAGSTATPNGRRGRAGDHPRACGEHAAIDRGLLPAEGPSPRVRGARGRTPRSGRPPRTIPARAGSTHLQRRRRKRVRDHPRACGEHWCRRCAEWAGRGPSPRVRGTRSPRPDLPQGRGTIPARAGNTAPPPATPGPTWDHPRACGEHPVGDLTPSDTPGPSPRVRGTPASRDGATPLARTIPARAGNTRT